MIYAPCAKTRRPAWRLKSILPPMAKKPLTNFTAAMRSVAKLSYAEAQRAFDGKCPAEFKHLNDDVLQPLWQAYQCMVQARERRQPLPRSGRAAH